MSAGSGGALWQTPYVNLFKHFGVGKWKKSSKDGDVTTFMDREVKATVFKVGGSVPANNYIMLPKSTSQSLGLTGHFFYLLFRPLAAKYFVIHLEVVTPAAMVIRISISNLFKEFKSTSTWLQFPYRHGQSGTGVISGGRAASSKDVARWTFLCLDLREILSKYLSCSYSHTRNIKLCANILVKNAFTSNLEYSPLEDPGTKGSGYLQAPPREMCLPTPLIGTGFLDVYNYVRFPSGDRQKKGVGSTPYQPKLLRGAKPGAVLVAVSEERDLSPRSAQLGDSGRGLVGNERENLRVRSPKKSPKKSPRPESQLSASGGGLEYYVERETDRRPGKGSSHSSVRPSGVTAPAMPRIANHKSGERGGAKRGDEVVGRGERIRPTVTWSVTASGDGRSEEKINTVPGKIKEDVTRGQAKGNHLEGRIERECSEGSIDEDSDQKNGEVHIHINGGTKVILSKAGSSTSTCNTKNSIPNFQPDPILKLSKVIGFGGATTSQALFVGKEGTSVIYPCHSLVVWMDIATGKQRFFSGHTKKVSCISLTQDGDLLASGQTGCPSVVRLWGVESGRCLALFQAHYKDLRSLHFSATGSVLCGVGRNSHGKTQAILWKTSQVHRHGDMEVLAKAHTEASIEKMRISGFDDTRMVSCGWDNVRFWRVKDGTLRSCPVNLADHHQMHFTDVHFQPGYHKDSDLCNRNVYACTTSGHVLEIHYKRISILRAWHLVPDQTIHSLALHEAFCVTGSEDGILRVWPMDFSAVFLEAQHEGEVTAVDVSADGFRVLAGTSVGNLGILDASSQKYRTVMRSHCGHVTDVSVNKAFSSYLVSCSEDKTIRVWDLPQCTQSYDFRLHGDCATCVCTGPRGNVFAAGFTSGMVRFFKLPSTDMLAEHKAHGGLVNGLIFSSNGRRLYSSSTAGSLALFSIEEGHTSKLIRLLGNVAAKSGSSTGGKENHTPHARPLALSQDDSRLALIGPLNFTVTVLDSETLNEVLRLDITPVTPSPRRHRQHQRQSDTLVDSAQIIAFSPAVMNELVVVTRTSRLLRFCGSSGRLLDEVEKLHRGRCTGMLVSGDGRYLVTAGEDQVLKVRNYERPLEQLLQVFIGHSDIISNICFTSDERHLLSCGDAIFLWEFMGRASTMPTPVSTPRTTDDATPYPVREATHLLPSSSPTLPAGLRSASPRKRVPTPATYDLTKMHSFTPLGQAADITRGGANTAESSIIGIGSSENPILDIDDDQIYEDHERGDNIEPEDMTAGKGSMTDQQEKVAQSRHGDLVGSESVDKVKHGSGSAHIPAEETLSSSSISSSSSSSSISSSLFPLSPPSAAVHQVPRSSRCGLAPQLYLAPPEDAGIKRRAVWGLNSCARDNLVWHPETGLFAYGSGCLGVVEDLSTGKQKHLEGHVEEVNCLGVQHDGRALAAACLSSEHAPCHIRVWDIASTKCIKVLSFHGHAVQSLSYSRDDRLLLSIGNYQDGSLAIWGAWDYSLLAATSLSHAVHAHAWNPFTAYEFVTVGAWDGVGGVNFWLVEEDMGGKKCQLKIHEPDLPEDLLHTAGEECGLEFTSVCYGAQPLVFVGSNNGVVSMWEGEGNTCLLFWRTESCELSCLLASGVESKLLVGTVTGALQLWSIEGETTPTTTPPRVSLKAKMEVDSGRITTACFNKNMQLGVVGSSSGIAWYINWPERNKLKLVGGHSAEVTSVAFSADSTHLASSSRDGSVAVWKLASREQLVVFRDPRQPCTSVAFAPLSTKRLMQEAQSRKQKKRKKIKNGRDSPDKRRDLKAGDGIVGGSEHGDRLREGVAVVPYLVAGYGDGSLRIFDAVAARVLKKMQPHSREVRAVAYSQDGSVILSGCSGGVVAVSSPASGLVVRVINDHRDAPVTDLQVAPKPIQLPCLGEGRWQLWLVASGDRRVSIWSADWQKDLCQLVDWLTFPGPPTAPDGTVLKKGTKCQYKLLPPSLARFSPSDPDTVVYAGYGMECCVQFYSLSRKTVFRTASLTHWPTAIDVSPQGHLLAFGCHERVLKLMDYEESSFQDYTGHQDTVTNITFSPSGKYLISTGNSTIQQWTILLH